jgi:glycosyltransferase involved in cell wall biosynthesis
MHGKILDVGLLSMAGNFDKTLGKGPQKYAYELYTHLSQIAAESGICVDKLELGFASGDFLRKASFTMHSSVKNLRKYDVIHCPAPIMLNPFLARGPIVTTVHELVIVPEGHMLYSARKRSLYDKIHPREVIGSLIRRQMMSSDYLIAVSKQAKEEAIKLGYDGRRISVINIGVNGIFISKPIAHKKHGKKFVAGYIGALNARKNVKFAIEAFRAIKDPDMIFEIWGKKSGEYGNLAAMAAGDRRIRFMGFAPEDALVDIYDRFDVFLFPSVYESHSQSILEARARGLPVILNKSGNLSQENREHCIEARSPGHMAQLITDLRHNGISSRELKKEVDYARRFTWHRCALKTIEFYKKIAE